MDSQTPTLTPTSLPGATFSGPNTTVNLATEATTNDNPTQVAYLTQASTTLTAVAVPGTTGLAVIDDQTLTFRSQGITLSNGAVVSLGLDGLVQSTTTATFQPLTEVGVPTAPGPVIVSSFGLTASQTNGSVATITTSSSAGGGAGSSSTTTPTSGSGASAGSATDSAASSSSSDGAAPSLSAGKAAMLLGAVGGLVACGL